MKRTLPVLCVHFWSQDGQEQQAARQTAIHRSYQRLRMQPHLGQRRTVEKEDKQQYRLIRQQRLLGKKRTHCAPTNGRRLQEAAAAKGAVVASWLSRHQNVSIQQGAKPEPTALSEFAGTNSRPACVCGGRLV
jgi:hypothetical protein